MAIRKSLKEVVVVEGNRAEWIARCDSAMVDGGFWDVNLSEEIGQVEGRYTKFTVVGQLLVSVRPTFGGLEIEMISTANIDNLFALFNSPNRKILRAFKDHL